MHFKDHFDMQHPLGLAMEHSENNTFYVCNMADASCIKYWYRQYEKLVLFLVREVKFVQLI